VFYLITKEIDMTATILKVKDATTGGKVLQELDVSLNSTVVSVKEIIEARVTQEVEKYNGDFPEYFHGLVQPTEAERNLNGFKVKDRKSIDSEKQVYTALDAFQKNGYFVLVDDEQAESLEQIVHLTPQTIVSFVKLTPLIGG
jgi:hypothetical protein